MGLTIKNGRIILGNANRAITRKGWLPSSKVTETGKSWLSRTKKPHSTMLS